MRGAAWPRSLRWPDPSCWREGRDWRFSWATAAVSISISSPRHPSQQNRFFDLYRILQDHEPESIKTWFLEKFGGKQVNCYHILRSLFFFEDADPDPEPISLDTTSWNQVKSFFLAHEAAWFDSLLS